MTADVADRLQSLSGEHAVAARALIYTRDTDQALTPRELLTVIRLDPSLALLFEGRNGSAWALAYAPDDALARYSRWMRTADGRVCRDIVDRPEAETMLSMQLPEIVAAEETPLGSMEVRRP